MRFIEHLPGFALDEDGAVAVDFVVLTSAIVALAIAVLLAIGNSTTGLADAISGVVGAITVTEFTTP